MKSTFISTAIITLALTASVSQAAMIKSDHQNAVRVQTAGLDLSTSQGQEVFYSRLKRAAKQVCGSSDFRLVGSVTRAQANKRCAKDTLSQTVDSIGHQELNKLHNAS